MPAITFLFALAGLVIQEAAFPEGGWRITETTSILGASFAGQQKFREAEALLPNAHAGMENDPQAPARRIHNALTRIVNLYDAWGKTDQAAEWRAKLPDTDPDSPTP